MNMKTKTTIVACALFMPFAAQGTTISGSHDGLSWTASNYVIGQTSTATIAGGGNPIYLGTDPKYRSTVGLLLNYGADGNYVCSGSLNASRNSIITAGHCVNIFGRKPDKVTAYFYNPVTPDPNETPVYTPGAPNVTTVDISKVFLNPKYTGNVIDQNDIAVLRLAKTPPKFARGYELYTGGDLTGVDYNIAGYGRRSDTGGAVGVNLGTGRLRQGDNRYDLRLGDPDFGGIFDSAFFGEPAGAQTDYSYLADFDNGLAANDASCGLAATFGAPLSGKYCNLGRGATEVSTAGGDSGGPQFVNGQLASITSYGLTFGTFFSPGDIDNLLNDSFGEFNGFVPIFLHRSFIANSVPEASTWAMLALGVGFAAVSRRRPRSARAVA